jgi:hypothetical protein
MKSYSFLNSVQISYSTAHCKRSVGTPCCSELPVASLARNCKRLQLSRLQSVAEHGVPSWQLRFMIRTSGTSGTSETQTDPFRHTGHNLEAVNSFKHWTLPVLTLPRTCWTDTVSLQLQHFVSIRQFLMALCRCKLCTLPREDTGLSVECRHVY